MFCEYDPYILPTIEFVGGETQELVFRALSYRSRAPFDLSGGSANFSVTPFVAKFGEPILSRTMTLSADAGGAGKNVLSVTLSPADTLGLYGKFIYQISVQDAEGETEIPKQGILYITNNINKSFLEK